MEIESIQHDSSGKGCVVLELNSLFRAQLQRTFRGLAFIPLTFLLLACFLLTCFLTSIPLTAQTKNLYEEQWRWKLFTTEEGLPSHRVFDIQETPDGTIWAATQRGLAWFNGYYWTAIKPSQGLPDCRVRQIEQSPNSTMLVLIDSTLYRGDIHGFTKIDLQYNGHAFPTNAIAVLPSGQHLLLSNSKPYLFDGHSVSEYPLPSDIASPSFKQMFRSADGVIWLSTPHNFYRLSNGEWSLPLSSPTSPLNIDLVGSNAKGGWLASVIGPPELRGIWEFPTMGTPIFHSEKDWKFPQKICEAPNGEMLVLTASGSIYLRRAGVWEFHNNPPRQMQDLLFLKFRTNGDIWVGTESGLYLYQASSTRWETWSNGKTDDRNSISEILVAKDSTIWVARALGIERHRKNGTVESIEDMNGTALGSVTALAEDAAHSIWIGSGVGTEGAYRYDGSRWEHFGKNEGLGARTVHKIVHDRKGRLWFLGLDGYDTSQYNSMKGPGVYILDSGKITPWQHNSGLPHGRVYAFAESKDGAYWFGTYYGLGRWKNGVWKHWQIPNGLRSQRIYTIAIDSQNCVWFGDQHNGLGFVTGDSIHYLTTSDGLVSDAVQDIKVDAHGKLWIATKGGLSSYYNGWWESFDAQSGLSNSRLWPVTPTNDKIYIGSSGGGVIIINKDTDTLHPPQVTFEIPAIEQNSAFIEWKPYSYFASSGSKNLETRFRIDNGDYSPWSTDHQVIATNLSPGTHTLQVQVKEIFRPVNEAGYSTTFAIPYPLHRNPYVLWPIGILLCGIVILVIIIGKRRRDFVTTLQESEENFRTLIQSMNEGVLHVNTYDTILYVNQRLCEMLGYSSDELIGKIGKDLFFSEEDKQIIDSKNELRLHNVSDKYQIQIRKKSGDMMWAEISGAPRHDHTDSIIGSIGIITDITERRHAEENLANMHELFQKTFHANPDASILTKQPERIIIDVNSAFETVFGYKREDVQGTSITSLQLWVDSDKRREALDLLTQTGTVRDFEFEFRTFSGASGHGIFFAELITLKEEKYVLNNVIDITKRKHTEEAIRRSEEQFRLIAENTPDLITILDTSGALIYTSPAYKKILGSKEYLNTQDVFANIHPDDRQGAQKVFRRIVITGENQQMDFRLVTWDGSIRYVESSGSAIKDAVGIIHQVIVVSRDVTERKQIEEQLLHSQRMESIGTLASGIAHDLNNILTPILLSIDLLRRTSTDERSKRMLDMIDGSAKRGASIVKQVLTFARGAEGVPTTIHVEHILGEIQKIIHETFLKSIEISIIAQNDIPTITADPTQLYQVLLNLCVNARDAMPNGGLIEIKAETVHFDEHAARKHLLTTPGDYVVLHVKDEGTGIPPEVIDRIFEPFFTTKEVGKGTGLGLSTVFAIIKNHNGFINVTSDVGKGTTFSIYLPADALTGLNDHDELPNTALSAGQTILVVDDEPAILEITVNSLIEHGYSIYSAGNGVEALQVFREHQQEIALVITDMVMPVMGGPTLINELHVLNPHLKIIGVSGLAHYGEVALEDNVTFIHKPYTLEKLISTIATVL